MTIPELKLGLVLRYGYLWSREATIGRDNSKESPACLVSAMGPGVRPRYVFFLPITHTLPNNDII